MGRGNGAKAVSGCAAALRCDGPWRMFQHCSLAVQGSSSRRQMPSVLGRWQSARPALLEKERDELIEFLEVCVKLRPL